MHEWMNNEQKAQQMIENSASIATGLFYIWYPNYYFTSFIWCSPGPEFGVLKHVPLPPPLARSLCGPH